MASSKKTPTKSKASDGWTHYHTAILTAWLGRYPRIETKPK